MCRAADNKKKPRTSGGIETKEMLGLRCFLSICSSTFLSFKINNPKKATDRVKICFGRSSESERQFVAFSGFRRDEKFMEN